MCLNGLFDFCTPWNCQKIADFLMVLREGRSLTGLLELVLYGSVVSGVFHWCYVGILLVFWGIQLVFRLMFSCSATASECSIVPPVFRVPLFRVPAFLDFTVSPHRLKFMQETAMFIFLLHLALSVRVNQ